MIDLILAPEATVRFKKGKLVIEGPTPGNYLVTDNAFIIFLLKDYSQPKPFDEKAVPQDPRERAQHETIRELCERGVLMPAPSHPEFADDPEAASRHEDKLVQRRLSEMAEVLYRLSGDFAGLASYCHRGFAEEKRALPSQTVHRMALVLRNLHRELGAMRRPFLASQLEKLNLPEPQKRLKIHIGSGPSRLPCWINIDIDQGDLMMNITWGLPFADNSADFVFFSHTLEHLYYPGEALKVLKDIHRVLGPGGIVRVIVPDLGKCIEAYHQNDRTFFESRKRTWDWWDHSQTRLEDFLNYAGAGPAPGQFFRDHKFGYDLETLTHLFTRAGFSRVEKSEYMSSEHAELRVDDVSLVAGAQYGDRYYSLFVEATK